MSQLHFPDDEPTTQPVSAFEFDFELYSLSKEDYKDLIYEEIMIYHDDSMRQQYDRNKEEYPSGALHLRYGKDRVKKKFQ